MIFNYCRTSFYLVNSQVRRLFFKQFKSTKMGSLLQPPENVYLMQKLDRTAFNKVVNVPVLDIRSDRVSLILPLVKQFLLKMENFKPVCHNDKSGVSIHLNPEIIKEWIDLPQDTREALSTYNIFEEQVRVKEITILYDNYSIESVLKAILPKHVEGSSSFTRIGHIVHVNLREHLIPYKQIIGEILFDKIKGCKSVVNKTNMIDNTYRNFQMEILKGDSNMHTVVKENNCKFELDFSTIYWNSRLCTEHERIVKTLGNGHVLFDVFAGIGPFSIPAASRKCVVYANDLNPHAYKWLLHNKKLNKVTDTYLKCFNLDGKQFILDIVKEVLPNQIRECKIAITMNLPALAVEFLHAFIGLLKTEQIPEEFNAITAYVYCFAKGENPEEIARRLICEHLSVIGVDTNSKIIDIFKVRTVSSMKEMMRVTVNLDKDILLGEPATTIKRKFIPDSNELIPEKKHHCIRANVNDGQKQEVEQSFQSHRSEKFKVEEEATSC